MSDTPETIADIAAEIRRGERMFWSLRDCVSYADRIEAAARRKREAAQSSREALERIRPLVHGARVTPYIPERRELLDGVLSIIDAALSDPAKDSAQ